MDAVKKAAAQVKAAKPKEKASPTDETQRMVAVKSETPPPLPSVKPKSTTTTAIAKIPDNDKTPAAGTKLPTAVKKFSKNGSSSSTSTSTPKKILQPTIDEARKIIKDHKKDQDKAQKDQDRKNDRVQKKPRAAIIQEWKALT